MTPFSITHTGNGAGTTNSDPVVLDWHRPITDLALEHGGSTTGFTAQYTLTPPDGYASESAWASAATWFATDISAATANTAASLQRAAQGVRLQANGTGTDTAVLRVIQPTG